MFRSLCWLMFIWSSLGSVVAQPPLTTEGMQAIGGNWFVRPGDKPVYFYRDGSKLVDLFSYHSLDSNRDGIANLEIRHDEKFLMIKSQGYPNHPTAIFPNSNNPNRIEVQEFTFRLPLVPQKADRITRLPMGPIGTAINGVVLFNPFEMEGMNAVEGYTEVWLDACCGHPNDRGVYHYHKYPSCVKSPFQDDGKEHSPIIGFAFDGYPVYGPYESTETMAKDLQGRKALDVCNGHEDSQRGYHYHVTPGRFPYIMGGYAGVVEASNNRGLRRAGEGPIVDNTQAGESRMDKVIVDVRPGIVSREQKIHTIEIELRPENARRRSLGDEPPSWVQIGPYEATKIGRQGNVVTVEIEIPSDATLGVFLDCHMEFASQQGRGIPTTLKRNDVMRVVE